MPQHNYSDLFQQALQENSNLVMDWLWYAVNVSSDVERLYCLGRALQIDPRSRAANDALRAVQSRYGRAAALSPAEAAQRLRIQPAS